MKRILLFLLTLLFSFSFISFWLPSSLAAFTDVPSSHHNFTAIEYVQSEGIVKGYDNGTYKPDQTINRAEFTKIIIEAIFAEFSGQNCFSDVGEEWFAEYICFAQAQNIIGGYPNGTFKPDKTVNFAEAAKITVLAFEHEVGAATEGEAWYEPFIEKLEELSAIPYSIAILSDISAQAEKKITRAEMAEIIYRLKINVIASPDDNVALFVPDGALPEGVDASELSIIKLEESPYEDKEGNPLLVYSMEPDGASFEKPIEFKITLENEDNSIPFVLHVSENGERFESISGLQVTLEPGNLLIRGNISHMSNVVISESTKEYFDIDIVHPPAIANVGEEYQVKVDIIKKNEILILDKAIPFESWRISEGKFSGVENFNSDYSTSLFSPSFVEDIPNSFFPDSDLYTVDETFSCQNEGNGYFVYEFLLRVTTGAFSHSTSDYSEELIFPFGVDIDTSMRIKTRRVRCMPKAPFEVTVNNPGDQIIGTDFSISSAVKQIDPNLSVSTWKGYGDFVHGVLLRSYKSSPNTIDDAVLVYETDLFEEEEVRCEEEGTVTLGYYFDLWNDANNSGKVDGPIDSVARSSGVYEQLLFIESDPITFECKKDPEIPEIVVTNKECILTWQNDEFNRYECGWHFQFKDDSQGVCEMASKYNFGYKVEYPNLKPEADYPYLFLIKNNMATHYNTGKWAYTGKTSCDTNTDDLKFEFVVYKGGTVNLSIYDVNPSIFTYNGDGDMLTVSGP